MTAIENFQQQLNLLSNEDWDRLFDLLPQMEGTDKFGKIAGGKEISKGVHEMHYWINSEVIQKFTKTMYDLNLVLKFDWGAWEEGKEILNSGEQNFFALEPVTLCKLLTALIRTDRFMDGTLVSNFVNGTIIKIIKALQDNYKMTATSETSNAKSVNLTEHQEKFIWLVYGECRLYDEVSKILGVERKTITKWESDKDATEFIKLKQYVSALRKTFKTKGIKGDFNSFMNWMQKMEKDKKCTYCGITEFKLDQLWEIERKNGNKLTKRTRGKKLELDRKRPNTKYDELDNIVWACYWCNNAKTDTFTHEEFLEVGKVISQIWKDRLLE